MDAFGAQAIDSVCGPNDAKFAFSDACENGHIHVLRWLKERFQLSSWKELKVPYQASMLTSACVSRDKLIANWLVKSFNIPTEEAMEACIYTPIVFNASERRFHLKY